MLVGRIGCKDGQKVGKIVGTEEGFAVDIEGLYVGIHDGWNDGIFVVGNNVGDNVEFIVVDIFYRSQFFV